MLPVSARDKSPSILYSTIFASLKFCGISLRDYFYRSSVRSCVYPLILEEVILFPLSGLIPETAVLFWHPAAVLLFLPQPTIFLVRNDAALSTLGDWREQLILLNPTQILGFFVLAKVSPIHPSQPLLQPLVKSRDIFLSFLLFSFEVKMEDISHWLWCLYLLHFAALEF